MRLDRRRQPLSGDDRTHLFKELLLARRVFFLHSDASMPAANTDSAKSPGRAALRAEGLTKTYLAGELEVAALRGVDITLYKGEIVVLLGQSGSGKSTLLNILGGLDVPTSGRVFFDELEITATTEASLTRYRREHVGFVFQFYNLVPSLTARENVALVTEIARNPMDPLQALDLVGLGDRINHFPAQLSGGEQQRVAIARAISKRPDILFCDEPTGALDSATGILVLDALETVNQELGTTAALITHNTTIGDIAHRVIRLADGRITNVYVNSARQRARDLAW